jgi:hypothetical protein
MHHHQLVVLEAAAAGRCRYLLRSQAPACCVGGREAKGQPLPRPAAAARPLRPRAARCLLRCHERRAPLTKRRAPLSNEEPTRRKTDAKHGTRTYICALDREICQVGKDGELGCQTIGEGFFSFCQKIMDGEGVCQTVGDALMYISHAGKWQISCRP